MATPEKQIQEMRPLFKVKDSFKKIILVKDLIAPKRDHHGIVTMSILDFLLNKESLDW